MPAPGAFTYSRAVREWAFVQVPLVSLSDFRKAAAERDVMKISPFDASSWETLDREGLLPPVAYALHGFWHHDQPANLENGDLIVREERGFVAWDELRAEARERNGADLYVLYGHWQLLSLVTIVDHLSPSTPLLALGRGLDEFREARVAYASAPIDRERLSDVARANRADELLLIRVQNLFMPSVRGGRYRGGPVVGLTEEAADWAIEQRRMFDYAAAAEDCEVTAEDLERLFDAFATRAHWIDPLERWFHLADQVKRRERERLKGAALRALDLYDAARVVRGWHAQLAGEPLPDVDELFGIHPKEAKRRMYGTDELRGNREVLPALLEDEPGQAPEFLIWQQDIEADNFTVAEACHVINATARQLEGLAEFGLVPTRWPHSSPLRPTGRRRRGGAWRACCSTRPPPRIRRSS